MSITRLIIIIIAIYLAYRFIFEFALPIYRTSRKIQKQFRGMQDQMNANPQQGGQQFEDHANVKKPKGEPSANPKDYIDFEEVK